MSDRLFSDRAEAGKALARKLAAYAGRPDVLVLALPRGGVPVAFEVAKALDAPLDIFLVRKLGVPGHEELAMGAIASGGVRVLNRRVVNGHGIDADTIERATREEARELARREQLYRGARPFPKLTGKTVLLVDDGLATGATMRAAVAAVRTLKPARVVVAVPVGPTDTCAVLAREADAVVCVTMPEPFFAVGQGYEKFSQTTDDEVRRLLMESGE